MVKSEIILKLSKKIHPKLKKSDLETILDTLVNTIIEGINEKKSCELRKFGRFSPKRIKGRTNARNPKSGQIIQTKDKIEKKVHNKKLEFGEFQDLKLEITNRNFKKN